MKTTNLILSVIAAMGIMLTSCTKDDQFVTPSGNVTTVTKTVTGFSDLEVSDPFNVYVTFSDSEEQLRVEANENLHAYIKIENKNDKLTIRLDNDLTIRHGDAVLNIYVTAKDINQFTASGASNIYLQDPLATANVGVRLEGASHLYGTVQVNEMDATLIGASSMEIEGSADKFTIDASGACEMNDFGFETKNLKADIEGASSISVTVTEKLDVKARGASTVYYKGDGVIGNQDLSDTSQIIRFE